MVIVILFSVFLIKKTEGQFPRVLMQPNEDDQVLQVGATLNLTCIINMPALSNTTFYNRDLFNITWTLPEQLTETSIVRKVSLLYTAIS